MRSFNSVLILIMLTTSNVAHGQTVVCVGQINAIRNDREFAEGFMQEYFQLFDRLLSSKTANEKPQDDQFDQIFGWFKKNSERLARDLEVAKNLGCVSKEDAQAIESNAARNMEKMFDLDKKRRSLVSRR